jgi:5-methyltetrahydropteroyltriglutamate--homocysteine methyltransferase
VVGSQPVPEWLKVSPSEAALRDALVVVTQAQVSAGIDVISDGELGRWDFVRNGPLGMVERFVLPMEGIEREASRRQNEAYRDRADVDYRARPPGVVVAPLGAGTLDLKREWEQVRAVSAHPMKVTVSSPYLLAKTVLDEHYHDLKSLTMAFAEILREQLAGIEAAVVQVDEPNLPGSPQDGELAARAINRVLAGATAAGQTAVHLCFGNYGGQTIQSGDYAHLIGFLGALECHHVVLETTRRAPEELARLREAQGPLFGVGVIDVKDLQIESADQVARRIEGFASSLGPERLAYVHPDCGLRMLPPEVANGKMRALVAARDLFLGA